MGPLARLADEAEQARIAEWNASWLERHGYTDGRLPVWWDWPVI